MDKRELHKKIVLEFLIALLWALGIIFILPKAVKFFMPFVIGWVIALIANPLVRVLEKRVKIARKHSSVLITVLVLGVVVLVLYCLVVVLFRQMVSLIGDLPVIIEEMQIQLELLAKKMQGLYEVLPMDMKEIFNDAGASVIGAITKLLSNISTSSLDGAGSLVKNVAEFFFMAIITVLSAYFFISEREYVMRLWHRMVPSSMEENVNLIKENVAKAIGGYFKAQFKIMFIIIGILLAGFWIIDIKYAYLLAIVVAALDFLPVFGTGTILFPWAFFEVLGGNYYNAICLLIIYLVCQLARQMLQPKMVGDSVGLNPLVALFLLFVGYRIKGVVGMIIAIPIGMVVISLYRAGLFDHLIKGARIIASDIRDYRKY